jgi:TrmH family RNA methyltransferase
MKTISSRQNPLFKRIREAIREHGDEIVIEGPKAVADAISAGWRPIVILSRGDGEESPAIERDREILRSAQDDTVVFTGELFDALASTSTPQNTIALFERPHATAAQILARRDTIAVALDSVQDPGNVGTIVRLAAAFDAAGVLLLPGCADPFGPKAIRSSAGAILNVRVATIATRELLDANVPLVYADMHGDANEPPAREAILVFGNEGAGVSDEIRQAARAISIPMSNRVESLNVASSAAILLSRSFAQR